MPTSSGKFELDDYLAELRGLGFEGIDPNTLKEFVNRGYFAVARRNRWSWDKGVEEFVLPSGNFLLTIGPDGEVMETFRSLEALYVTAPERLKLQPASDQDFFNRWLATDLSEASVWGKSQWYYIYESQLYILPPPNVDLTIQAYFTQRPIKLQSGTDVPITPMHLDEAILLAAKARCHKKVQEVGLAQIAESDLEAFFDDSFDDEELIMAEQPNRTLPDDSWL